MSNARDYQITCLSEVVSPITHSSGSHGNESLVMRVPVVTGKGVTYVPSLTGNMLRNRLVRTPGARWLVEQYGLRGQLSPIQLNFLFSGGALTQSTGREDLERIVRMQTYFPHLRMLGGCLPDQILGGCLSVSFGELVCEENRSVLQALLPDGWELPSTVFRPAESFVSGYQYTRRDVTVDMLDLTKPVSPDEDSKPGKTNQMIFAGQAVTKGAVFLHNFVLKNASRLEVGALLLALSIWQQSGATVGGAAGRGHGRLSTKVHHDCDGDPRSEYVQHVASHREKALAWMNDVFVSKKTTMKEKTPTRGRKGKTEIAAVDSEIGSSQSSQPDLFGGIAT